MYHIRLDTSGLNPFVNWLSESSNSILVSQEGKEDNPHLHIVVDIGIPVQTIRNRIRKEGYVGNKSYSVSVVKDKIKAIAYVLKEGDILLNTFPEEDIRNAREYDLKVKSEIKKKASIKEGIEQYAVSKKLDLSKICIQTWSRLAVEYYKQENILFREFQIVSQVQTLYLKYNPEAVTILSDRISERIKKN